MRKREGLIAFALCTTWITLELWRRLGGRSLAVIGPVVAASGAALLAYDVVRAGVRAGTRRMYEEQAKGTGEMYRRLIRGYRELPDRTHADAKREWIEQAEHEIELEEAAVTERWRNFENQEVEASLRYGLRGFLLVVVGSLMQSAAAFLAG